MIPSYYKNYVDLLLPDTAINSLKNESIKSIEFYKKISEEKSLYKYESNKWSIREVLGHTCDTEQIFNYRALSALRGESKALPGYDQDEYVSRANFDAISLESLMTRFELLRTNSIIFFEDLTDEELSRRCFANNLEFTVSDLGLIIAGHDLHHRKIIAERYLN